MKRKLMFLMTFLFIGIGLMTAQTSRVTGLVTSEEDGQPVVGASILVNGTTLGTITESLFLIDFEMGGNILPEFLMNFPVFSLLFQLSSALNKNMFDNVLISVFCGL